MATSIQVVIDCADPDRLATFWATALGYTLQEPPEGFASWQAWLSAQGIPESEWNSASAIIDPERRGPRLYFQRVPEPKTVKNRLHLDLNVSGGAHGASAERLARLNTEVERLVAAGARQVEAREERGEYWIVMRDPEGNEFCLQ